MDLVLERYYRGKCVFITGAAAGLGKSLALKLAEYNVKLVLTDKDATRLEEVVKKVNKQTECVSLACDVRNYQELLALKEKVSKIWFVEIVIANAGVGGINPADQFSLEIDQSIMSINYFGVVNSLNLFLDEMKEKRRGHLVGISSLASIRGLPSAASYSASKAAINNFLESWRLDLTPLNIDVSCIRPGFIKTAMTNHNAFPLPFMVDSEEAAKLTLLAIAKNLKVYSFPWIMGFLSLINKFLPNWAYDFLLPKLNPRDSNTPLKARIF